MILFFNILAWLFLAMFLIGMAGAAFLRSQGYNFTLHGWVIPAVLVDLAWLVSRACS